MNEIESELLKEKQSKTSRVIKEENSDTDEDYYDRFESRARYSDPEDYDIEEQRPYR